MIIRKIYKAVTIISLNAVVVLVNGQDTLQKFPGGAFTRAILAGYGYSPDADPHFSRNTFELAAEMELQLNYGRSKYYHFDSVNIGCLKHSKFFNNTFRCLSKFYQSDHNSFGFFVGDRIRPGRYLRHFIVGLNMGAVTDFVNTKPMLVPEFGVTMLRHRRLLLMLGTEVSLSKTGIPYHDQTTIQLAIEFRFINRTMYSEGKTISMKNNARKS